MPITRDQLSNWVADNIVEFRQRMKEAPRRRRALNNRLWPKEGQPPPVDRIAPAEQRRTQAEKRELPQWTKVLDGRTGWYGLKTDTGARLFWLQRHRNRPYVVDMEPCRRGNGYSITTDHYYYYNYNNNDNCATTTTIQLLLQLRQLL